MGAMEKLKEMAKENRRIKYLVEELEFIKDNFNAEMPEEELQELVDYLKIEIKDCPELEKIEAANDFKLQQIKKIVSIMDVTFEEHKELIMLVEKLEWLIKKHDDVNNLEERLIVNEKFSGLLDEIFEVLMLRAGQ